MQTERESIDESGIPEKIDLYKRQIETSGLEPEQGDLFRRIAGNFVLRRPGKNDLKIQYVGSTHETEPIIDYTTAIHVPPSAEEQTFIRTHLLHGPCRTMLVEQGHGDYTKDHMDTLVDNALESHQELRTLTVERRADDDKNRVSEMDMRFFSREAAQNGYEVYNVDLMSNAKSIRYVFERRGAQEVIEFLCRQLESKCPDSEKNLPTVIAAILRKQLPEHSFLEEDIQRICADYIPKIQDIDVYLREKDAKDNNDFREEFMVNYLNDFEGDEIVLLLHTSHLLSVMNKTKQSMQSFEPGPTELAEKVYQEFHPTSSNISLIQEKLRIDATANQNR